MNRKLVLLMALILLTGVLGVAFKVQKAEANGMVYIDEDGTVYPSTAPILRDKDLYTLTDNIITIDVEGVSGIVVKRNNMTLDGAGYILQGRDSWLSNGIYLSGRSNITIRNIQIQDFNYGILLEHSSNNSIVANNITKNYYGILLAESSKNALRSNRMTDNEYNFGIWSSDLSNFINDIDTSNTVNGKPVYYWINRKDLVVPLDAGYAAFVNCTGITVQNLNLTDNSEGILLVFTRNSTITGNSITNNLHGITLFQSLNNNVYENNVIANRWDGISLAFSSNNTLSRNNITEKTWASFGIYFFNSSSNTISGNNITKNENGIRLRNSSNNDVSGNNITANGWDGIGFYYSLNNSVFENKIANNNYGVGLSYSSDSKFYHNNFIDNNLQVRIYTPNYSNFWDDSYPSGGNYWSDHIGEDLHSGQCQNETYYDWIGDNAYVIDESNQDNYPLMVPYNTEEQEAQVAYRNLLGKYNELLSDYGELLRNLSNLQSSYDQLNASYSKLQSEQEKVINELGTFRNLTYIFVGTIIVLIVTTVYFSKRKSKKS
jgi:parallel beta-helix repeat protein